jgi:gliding motility-associated-like protein
MKNSNITKLTEIAIVTVVLLPLLAGAQVAVDVQVTPPSCYGYTNGSAQALPTGGTSPYSYWWSNNQGGQTTYGLPAGSYTVTVTDAAGLTATAIAIVPQPDSLVAHVAPLGSICQGNQGDFIAFADNASPPLSFQWSNGANTQTISNPDTGFLYVTITDANGCFDVGGLKIPAPLTVSIHTEDVLCPGDCDGSAEAIISGGVGPYAVQWNTGGTTQVIHPLPGGTYTATVTDGNGCTAVASGTVYEPPPIVITFTVAGQCSAVGDASATASATGGTPPFSYEWSTGVLGQSVSGLAEGYYFVTVTDSLGCKKSETLAISDGASVVIASFDDATCAGLDDGSAQAVATSGLGPLSYLWSNGQTTPSASQLPPGDYGITLTDGAGCQDSAAVSIGADFVVTLATRTTDAGCNDAMLGTASAFDVAGGTAPYSYKWNDPAGQTTPVATGLGDGAFIVTVTDAIGCTASASAVVAASEPLTISVVFENASCQNTYDGSAALGGVSPNVTPPLSFFWSNGAVDSFLTNILPGAYSLTVTDALHCTGSAGVFIPSDASVEARFTGGLTGCTGLTATAHFDDASVFSPANAPIVSWFWLFENGDPATAAGLGMTVTTSDSALTTILIVEGETGCLDTLEQTFAVANVFEVDLVQDPFACASDTLHVTAVFDPADSLAFEWQSGSPNLILLENGLPSADFIASDTGTYLVTLTLTTPLGCTLTDSLTANFLPEHLAFNPSLVTYQQCEGTTVDFANLNPGLAGAFAWFFDFPDTAAVSTLPNPTYTYPDTGHYLVALVPILPCLQDTFFLDVFIDASPAVLFSFEKSPCSDTVTVSFTDGSTAPGGVTGWQWTFSNGSSSGQQNPAVSLTQTQSLAATLTITFGNSCSLSASEVLDVFVFNQGFPDDSLALCHGETALALNPGGDSTYTYVWSPAAGLDDPNSWNPTATLNGAAVFSVTISDDSSGELCSAEKTVTVFVPSPINLQAPDDVVACQASPRQLEATASGSVAAFHWASTAAFTDTLSPNAMLEIVPEAPPRLLFVKISDPYGCTAMDSVLAGNYAVQAQVGSDPKVCIGLPPEVTIEGLLPGDTAIWKPYDPNSQPLNDTATFTLTVVNPQGCTLSENLFLEPFDLSRTFYLTPDLDTIVRGQGTILRVFSEQQIFCTWTPDASLETQGDCIVKASPSEPTTYIVTVSDPASGCTASDTATVCVVSNLCDYPMIFVPNVFSPNGDGLNDVLYVRGFNAEEILSFEIYNRWGQRVFETDDLAHGWDGKVDGKEVAGDVFAYFLRVKCQVGGEYFTKGNVTVLR